MCKKTSFQHNRSMIKTNSHNIQTIVQKYFIHETKTDYLFHIPSLLGTLSLPLFFFSYYFHSTMVFPILFRVTLGGASIIGAMVFLAITMHSLYKTCTKTTQIRKITQSLLAFVFLTFTALATCSFIYTCQIHNLPLKNMFRVSAIIMTTSFALVEIFFYLKPAIER